MVRKKDMTTFSIHTKLNAGEPLPDNSGIPIEGFCIHNGLFKEIVEVPKTELGNAEKTVENAQFRKNHGDEVEDVIGRVTFAKLGFDSLAQKDGVYYKAFIDQDEAKIAGKVAKGLVNDVSIGFDFYPECSECGEDFRGCPHWFDEAHIIARNVEVFELSLVTRGADADATANIQQFMAQFNDKPHKPEENIKEKMNLTKGGKLMAEEDKNAVDLGDVVEKLTASQKEALKAQQLADAKTKEAEDLAKKLKAAEEEKLALEKDKKDLASKNEKLEKDHKDATSKLTEKELSDKKLDVEKLVEAEIARKLTKESDKDSRIEELMGVDQTGLDVAKDLINKFKMPRTNDPKIPPVQGIEKFLDKDGQLDLGNKAVQQRFVHDIFRYDRVFQEAPDKEIPGQSYMGFYSHLEDKKMKLTK
jgi:hypothetical protein